MNEEITHLVINWITIEDNVVLVGATDDVRWRWDIEEGMSGADTKTIVYVTLTDNGKGISPSEQAHFHCLPKDPTRAIAMSNIIELFDIAWSIKNKQMSLEEARETYFGKVINNS
ncbi:hypothetical protein [uncultured Dokdonia sp.]|uniref:hypothetical protein n=1 Tax=uncultured Dokdonia sp. TaxID=575653 RepID=UPI0026294340|nr:hypothetical protein [uncultured Dokdonia sp.]